MNHIFCHSDQDEFYKVSEIIWKYKKFDSVIVPSQTQSTVQEVQLAWFAIMAAKI